MLGFTTIYVEILISGCVIFYIPESQTVEKQTEIQSASPRTSNRAIQFRIVLSLPPFEIELVRWAKAVASYLTTVAKRQPWGP
jgi:hypothetical protein